MIKTLVVDDEQKAIELLKLFLKDFDTSLSIVGEANSIKDAQSAIEKHQPDLVFLDIEMPDGTAFNLLERLKTVDFKIIFVTAYDQYAIKAFKYSTTDYLLKPIDINDFKNAVEKAIKQIKNNKPDLYSLEVLLSNFSRNVMEQQLIIHGASSLDFVKVKNIVYCNADSTYTNFHLTGNKKVTSSKSMSFYENLLPEDHFFRVNRSCLINLNHILKYLKNGTLGKIVMTNKQKIEISRRKKREFLELISHRKFLFE